jgi:hypothetical protein
MCTLYEYLLDETCAVEGSFGRVLVMKKETFDANTVTKTMGTGTTRGQLAVLTGLPLASAFEIEVDRKQDTNSFETTPSDGAVTVHTQTVTLTRTGVSYTNQQLARDLEKCCDLIVFLQLNDDAGTWIMVGKNEPKNATSPFLSVGLKMKSSLSTGGANTDNSTTTYVFAPVSGGANVPFIPLSAAAGASLEAAIA